jgi:hypothetical protein
VGRGHERSGWHAAALAAVVVVALAACGSDSTRTDSATSSNQWFVPVEEPTAVVAGDGAGWIRDEDGRMWRVGADGTVEETEARVPEGEGGGFQTFFAGRVAFGMTRCAPPPGGSGCPEMVHQVTAVSADGRMETVEVAREQRTDEAQTVGLRLHGVVGDRLVMSTAGSTVVELDVNLRVAPSAIPVGPGEPKPCVIGSELYGILDTSQPASGSPSTTPTSMEQSWTVAQWDGQRWALVPGGMHRVAGGSTVQCLADGFLVEPVSPGPAAAAWTPRGGWHEPDPSIAELDLAGSTWDDPRNDYVIQEGRLHEVDLDDGLLTTTMSSPGTVDTPVDLYDASGTILFACGEESGGLRCAIGPKG